MNEMPQISDKKFKTLTINSFIGYIIIGIWGIIIVGAMINKVKSVGHINDNCTKYNLNNECIEYK